MLGFRKLLPQTFMHAVTSISHSDLSMIAIEGHYNVVLLPFSATCAINLASWIEKLLCTLWPCLASPTSPNMSEKTKCPNGTTTTNSHPYLSGNFAPIRQSLPLTPSSWEGEIPADLAGGQYVRNGSNPFSNDENRGREAHWFDGDGMLSGVLFRRQGGTNSIYPEFVNQYLVTDVFVYAQTSRFLKKPIVPSVAMLINPCTTAVKMVLEALRTLVLVFLSRLPGPQRAVKKISVANTAVLYHDGRALATCESGPPLRVALPHLETIGWFNGRAAENEPHDKSIPTRNGFGGEGMLSFMKEWITAHPRVDHWTGELIAFHSVPVRPFVSYSIVPPTKGGSGGLAARLHSPVPGVASPKMMHDFGVSRKYTVIMDLPLSLNVLNLVRGDPVLSYDSKSRARFGVFPRYRPHAVQWFETNPCIIFHTANCWDSISTSSSETGAREIAVNLLACRLTSASLVFSAGNIAPPAAVEPVPPEYAEEEQCRLYYYRFLLPSPFSVGKMEPKTGISQQWALSAIAFEFPSVSPRCAMTEARFAYGCSSRSATYSVTLGRAAKIDILAKIDVAVLVARGKANPPQTIKGCVDTRSVPEILADAAPDDPISLFEMPGGWYAQEPRFVPRSDSQSEEDDGWLLTYVFDESTQLDERGRCRDDAISELWVIDAKGMKDVVARIKLPQRVPYGFHGHWFSEAEITHQRPFEHVREMPLARTAQAGNNAWLRDKLESWLG
ncbi:retinal pigment epithelial membrane protein [Podospora didyma]|uniref:Retinal pigment epithelial membrane protein n=1 Tax=Podospora didyma TaxID=330526 RepID=A0AAE0P4N4_9PEZI|nr:retinal pigment epithelial membrane protein [Podospora didyma]